MIKIIKRVNHSASFAIAGIKDTIKEEFMMRFQVLLGLSLFFLSIILNFNIRDIILMFILFIVLTSAELMNTAVENTVDLISNETKTHHGKRAKDSAGAAVFIISVSTVLVFIILLIINKV
jgi:diacylglycerol kinase